MEDPSPTLGPRDVSGEAPTRGELSPIAAQAEEEQVQGEVVGGNWSVAVGHDAQLQVFDLVLNGVSLLPRETEHIVPEGLFLMIEGEERHPVQLQVLSALDDAELDGIEIWPGPYSFPTPINHPGLVPGGSTYRFKSDVIPGYQSIDGTTFEVVRSREMIDVRVDLVPTSDRPK